MATQGIVILSSVVAVGFVGVVGVVGVFFFFFVRGNFSSER